MIERNAQISHSIGWHQDGVQSFGGFCSRPESGSPPLAKPLHKTALHIEGLLLAQHVVARPREFVRDRLDRHDAVALALLTLVEALGLRAVAQREVGGPPQTPRRRYLLPFFALPSPFFLPLLSRRLSTQRQ